MYASSHIDKLRNCIEMIICCLSVYELESVIQCFVDTTVCSHSRTAFLRSSFIIPDRTDKCMRNERDRSAPLELTRYQRLCCRAFILTNHC